jgi:hypothetical protein
MTRIPLAEAQRRLPELIASLQPSEEVGVADRMYEFRRGGTSCGRASPTRTAPTVVIPVRESYLHSATPRSADIFRRSHRRHDCRDPTSSQALKAW